MKTDYVGFSQSEPMGENQIKLQPVESYNSLLVSPSSTIAVRQSGLAADQWKRLMIIHRTASEWLADMILPGSRLRSSFSYEEKNLAVFMLIYLGAYF